MTIQISLGPIYTDLPEDAENTYGMYTIEEPTGSAFEDVISLGLGFFAVSALAACGYLNMMHQSLVERPLAALRDPELSDKVEKKLV